MTFELDKTYMRTELQDANRRILELERENAELKAITMPCQKPSTCSVRNLSVLAYANGFTHWHYKAATLSDIVVFGYFSDVCDMLAKGDMIFCSASDGVRIYYVVSSDHGSVTIAQT
jgi:hypothetical protein